MSRNQLKPPPTSRKFRDSWGELDYLCRKVSFWLYERGDRSAARRYFERLSETLSRLPKKESAIVREEGLALLHELEGELDRAIAHRQQEINLMRKLHASVAKSIKAGEYDSSMGDAILSGKDKGALEKRQALLDELVKASAAQRPPRAS
jgi:hypothetical protein